MSTDFDVCVIGSGAGGGPVALTLAEAGYSVVVLEKGPWYSDSDFFKDEIMCCRRKGYQPDARDQPQVIETKRSGEWRGRSTYASGRDFWNGNCVGGSSNFMSGFFHRLKPDDFRLASITPAIEGANTADWPITYDELEPYYTRVEHIVGVSGRVVDHPYAEPRSTPDFPFPPVAEHVVSGWIDEACAELDMHPFPVPRAILSYPAMDRRGCEYSGYCGSYGCSSGAKGSSRAALLSPAIRTGRCEVRPNAMVKRLVSDSRGRVVAAEYFDRDNKTRRVDAKLFVVACQAVETARLLLLSTGPKHPKGLGNNHDQVGKNLVFSAGGSGGGDLPYGNLDEEQAAALRIRGPFVNRALQDWYFLDDSEGNPWKGGTIEFMFRHPNPILRANSLKRSSGKLVWGRPLQQRLESYFTESQHLRFEVFCDWLPNDDCFVRLDPDVKDKWGLPVARMRLQNHPQDLVVGRFMERKGVEVLAKLGADNIRSSTSGAPPSNLQAGGCRFGTDPRTSVLDRDCRCHDVDNLYVSDGSFMPTGGSVPHTWTIYANAFRVADAMVTRLGGVRAERDAA